MGEDDYDYAQEGEEHMTTHITKTWFDGEKVVTQEIPESEVYAAQRPWVGLTEEEVLEEEEFINHRYGKHINETTAILLDFVRQIEAKLKEKNGG